MNNFLSDFPAMTVSGDEVDREWVDRPQRWDVGFIRRFMVIFGLVSSALDFLTFGLLLLVLRTAEPQFRTAWFIESLLTELAILLVVRTRRPLFRSKPGRLLRINTVLVGVLTFVFPYVPPRAALFGFVPLPVPVLLWLVGILTMYIAANEAAKSVFYSRSNPSVTSPVRQSL